MNHILDLTRKVNHFFVHWIDRSFNDRPLSHRLGKGTLWSFVGVVISRGLTILASIIVARLIGKMDFGQVGIIQSTILMLTSFAGFGSGIMATKFVSEYCRQNQQKAGSIIFLAEFIAFSFSFIVAVLFAVFSKQIAVEALAAPTLEPLLKISAILLFFSTLVGTQVGILSGFEAFKRIAQINLITGILSAILLPIGALFHGLSGIIWAMVIVSIANWGINIFVLRNIYRQNNIRYRFEFNLDEFKLLWRFNLPSLLSGLTFTGASWVCNTMLVNASGYGEMGVINATNNWYAAILFFPFIISRIIFPIMSERLGIDERKQTLKIVTFSIKINALSILPFVLLLTVFSPFFMSLFGESFRSSWLPLVFTILTAWLLAIQIPVGQMIAARNKMWLGFYMNMGWAVLFIGFNYLFIDHGANGLVVARFIAYCIHSVWTFAWFFHIAKKFNVDNPVII